MMSKQDRYNLLCDIRAELNVLYSYMDNPADFTQKFDWSKYFEKIIEKVDMLLTADFTP